MSKVSNVPQIRFKGFTDAWEQRKLGDVANYRNGKAHEQSISENGKYVVVNSKFVSTNGEVRKFSCEQIEPLLKNEIVFVLSDVPNGRALARTFLIPQDGKYTLNQRIAGITPNEEMDCYFLNLTMNRNRYFLRFDDGVKQTNLSVNDVMGFSTYYPLYEEQQLCGQFFQKIDNLITLHQRKYNQVVNFKKAMLEKMFPQDGKDIPEIRFKGNTDAWEQRKVADMFKITRGYVLAAPLTSEQKSDEMPYPVYSSQTKDQGLMGYYKDYLYEDAITWTTDGANAGTVNYRAGKFYCTNVCGVLLADKVIPNQMIAEALNNVAKGHVSYVGNPKLMNNVMAEIEISLPSSAEERDRIAEFFSEVDDLITLHQRRLQQLKNIKKALLEKMFV
jgi:type I restriction-modification system DNA specificity subunit